MLNLSRRHSATKCGKTKRRDCTCPVWVSGSLHGKPMRKSLGIRNWEAAQAVVRELEAKRVVPMMLSEGFDKFLADCRARMLTPESVYKYELLKRGMVARFGAQMVGTIGVDALSEYRNSWKLSASTARLRIELIRKFFRFCIERGWCEKNPATAIKSPKVVQSTTLPFTAHEITAINMAVGKYPDVPKGRRAQVKAFVLLLAHTGLRIRDVTLLTKDKISDGRLLLRTAKTGQAVHLPLPDLVIEAIEPLGERLFSSGEGTPKSAVAAWERSLKTLFKLAEVKGKAHMFRDSMAVKLLLNGISIEDVAAVLGNSARIVEKHYAPWVKVRQDRLEEAVRRTFAS